MNIQEYFSPARFIKVLKKDIVTNYKFFLGISGVVSIVLLVVYLAQGSDFTSRSDEDFNEIFFSLILLIGGFWFSAGLYRDLNDAQERQLYLSLPASTVEKYASKLLISTVGYLLAIIVIYSIFSLIARFSVHTLYGVMPPAFQPFGGDNLNLMGMYVLIQPIYLLGGIAFNKFAFLKTIAATSVVNIVVLLIVGLVAYLLVVGDIDTLKHGNFGPTEGLNSLITQSLPEVLKWVAIVFVMPLFWVIGYFKLKEREV